MKPYESPAIRASFNKNDVLGSVAAFQSTYVNFNDPILDFENG